MKHKNEKGFALVLSLVLLMVMSLLGGSLIVITSTDHQSNNSSDEYQQAFYVAETALLEAEKSVINKMMGPWVNADTAFTDVPTGMTEGEREEWDSMVENIQNAAVAGLARNTDRWDLPSNLIPASDTPCFISFWYINSSCFLVTDHQVNRNFGTLIQAVFTDGDLDDLATADIIAKEKEYMERFRYEYFITNIGAAEYKGAGSSLKKTSTMSQGSGTAYKIYGCGYLMPSGAAPGEFDDPDILVPLESVIVLSN